MPVEEVAGEVAGWEVGIFGVIERVIACTLLNPSQIGYSRREVVLAAYP